MCLWKAWSRYSRKRLRGRL